jgi:hypothetical protein
MATAEFRAALARVLEAAGERPTAVMCAEAYWRQCHRQLLADAAAAAGWEVVHLLPGRRESHPLNPELHVSDGGELSYPAADGEGSSAQPASGRVGSAARRGSAARQRSLPGFDSGPVR